MALPYGCRSQRRAQSTGTLVGVYDARVADMDVAPDRWAVMCEDHANLVGCATLALANATQAAPEEWCEDCDGILADAVRIPNPRRSPLRMVCRPWPFASQLEEPFQRKLCRWTLVDPAWRGVAEFVDRGNPRFRAILHPSTKTRQWQLSWIDDKIPTGDMQGPVAELLREVPPINWRLKQIRF